MVLMSFVNTCVSPRRYADPPPGITPNQRNPNQVVRPISALAEKDVAAGCHLIPEIIQSASHPADMFSVKVALIPMRSSPIREPFHSRRSRPSIQARETR